MGVISEEIKLLLELQKLDMELSSFDSEIEKKRLTLQETESSFELVKNKFESLDAEISESQTKIENLETDNEKFKNHIEESRQRMFAIKSQKEFVALKSEIKTSTETISSNETQILELLEKIEKLKTEKENLTENYNQFISKIEEINKEIEESENNLEAKKNSIIDEYNAISSKIKPGTLSKYKKIINGIGAPALSRIDNTVCSQCCIDIPPQVVNEVRKENRIFVCENCNRLLYWAE